MPTIITDGAASAQGYGFAARTAAANYIEDVFSTYLYTGTGSAQTITNGVDLSGKGGLVWMKGRSTISLHGLYDTARGATFEIGSDSTAAQTTQAQGLTSFLANGFSIGSRSNINSNGATLVSWTFRKQPKFFDVVTYTGSGVETPVNHSLGSVPGFYVVKRINSAGNWLAYHRSLTTAEMILLNSTAAATGNNMRGAAPTATQITPAGDTDINGATYVAYLFAHDAGGFGATGADNVISCGSFTTDGSGNATVNLGWEPQWILVKKSSDTGDWRIFDNMRGLRVGNDNPFLAPNLSQAEAYQNLYLTSPSSTSFFFTEANSQTYIYIAIRRGPMKTPTSGTSVFGLNARTGTGANATVTGGQTDDAVLIKNRGSAVASLFSSRLTDREYLVTSSTAAGVTANTTILQISPWDVMDGVKVGTLSTITNASANTFINYLFRRAPGFFDVVCYTGTGGGASAYLDVSHNLGVTPEMIIVKRRDSADTAPYSWPVYHNAITTNGVNAVWVSSDGARTTDYVWRRGSSGQKIDASTFSLNGNYLMTNASGGTYVAYLFATVAGVSKVGSYTGTGTTNQIDCGFTGGARFVLIKRTDSTGDWYVWDTARGIIAGNDPYLRLNLLTAEVTGTDYVDTYSAGFEISSTAPAAINANGGTFIFLAIA